MQIHSILQELKKANNYRTLQNLKHKDIYIYKNNKKLINLASNDYLGLSSDTLLYEEFSQWLSKENYKFSSSSSRSLSGGFAIYEEFEEYIANLFMPKKALLFNSGYHLNISCIQALSLLPNTLFLADKFVHASIIDGLRLGGANFKRFGHNDINHLAQILEAHHTQYENIIIVSEGLFSMEGDFVRLQEIIALKKAYNNVYIYLDEAHSIGSIGENGLGLAKSKDMACEIDFLVFTFGKAISSVGACMICESDLKEFFVNKARGLIYSTALPPINVAFSYFVFQRFAFFAPKREHLESLSRFLHHSLLERNHKILGESYIISLLVGENKQALDVSHKLESFGLFAPAIKEPTIPKGTARIRFSLNAALKESHITQLIEAL